MTNDILKSGRVALHRKLLIGLTLMLSGRAMTLAFIGRAGGTGEGDPPIAWLLPLLGDAFIGVTALFVVYLLMRGRGLWAWTGIVVWNALAIWDALSAFVVHRTTPWPDFFMVQIFGDAMFFMACTMHIVCLGLAMGAPIRGRYGLGG